MTKGFILKRLTPQEEKRGNEEIENETALVAPFPYVLKSPLLHREWKDDAPTISQTEIVECCAALYTYQLALAAFEEKRAALVKKLLLHCYPEEGGNFSAHLEDNKLVLVDRTSTFFSNDDQIRRAEERVRC